MPNKQEYCERHGYKFVHPELTDKIMRGFERLPNIIELLKSGEVDWVWVLGCDALITNMSIRLETIIDESYGMIVPADSLNTNIDSYLINRKNKGLEILETLVQFHGNPIGGWEEQSTLDFLCDLTIFKNVRKIVPQRTMNSYRCSLLHVYDYLGKGFVEEKDSLGNDGNWQPGDFVLHVPGVDYETKMKVLTETVPQIQR